MAGEFRVVTGLKASALRMLWLLSVVLLLADDVAASTGSAETRKRHFAACQEAFAAHPAAPAEVSAARRREAIRQINSGAGLDKAQVKLLEEESAYLGCGAGDRPFSMAEYERRLRCSELRGMRRLVGARLVLEGEELRGPQSYAVECRVMADFGKLDYNRQEATRQIAMREADLKGVTFRERPLFADLSNTRMERVNFQIVDLAGSSFRNVGCSQSCVFHAVNAEGVDFSHAALGNVRFSGGGSLRQANFDSARVGGMVFEPDPQFIPEPRAMSTAMDLEHLRWRIDPVPMGRLRDALKKEGYRDAWLKVNHAYRDRTWDPETWLVFTGHTVERGFDTLLFGFTSGYGLYPGRPLMILAFLIPLFALLYLVGLRSTSASGIWAVWPIDRVSKSDGSADPQRLSLSQPFPPLQDEGPPKKRSRMAGTLLTSVRVAAFALTVACLILALDGFEKATLRPESRNALLPSAFALFSIAVLLSLGTLPVRRWRLAWRSAFYFSVLSAFHFGWRDLNVGSWLQRVQPREYALRATGWVRVASGVQSLLSVFLIALWVVTYFGGALE